MGISLAAALAAAKIAAAAAVVGGTAVQFKEGRAAKKASGKVKKETEQAKLAAKRKEELLGKKSIGGRLLGGRPTLG